MTDYSKRLKTEAQGYGIPPQSNEVLSKAQNIGIRDSIVQNPNFQDIVEKIRVKLTGTTKPLTGTGGRQAEQLSKDDIATILRRQMDALPDGDKAKTDAAIKYAELYQYKREDPKDENEYLPHIWLPQPCFLCQYKAEVENNRKKANDNGEKAEDKD